MQNGKEYLEFILTELNQKIEEAKFSIEEGKKDIEGMHEYYWENYTEMDQYGYENFDNQQNLLQQVKANQEQQRQLHLYKKMKENPFFGRVDFLYEDEDEPESFYIGIGNLSKRAGLRPLIYDWRAPISGLFYDFDKGPASYEAPIGTIHGEVTSKWQYKIKRGKLVYEFESDVKIDDDILKAELGSHGDVKLKNIIRTIQKEQNAIIRNTKDRIMVIQGGAGSGKTSIALHRIAYLLYHDRKHLKSSDVLILSPNSIFANYISHILPELGEEPIREMSFDIFAYKELKDVVSDCEDRYHQLERCIQNPTANESCVEKQSSAFISDMEMYLCLLEDGLMNFRDFHYQGYTLEEKRIIELFYTTYSNIPLLSRMYSVFEYAVDEFETLRGTNLNDQELELFQSKFMRMYETRDVYLLYHDFLEEYGYKKVPKISYEKRMLLYEDVYPLLYFKYRLLEKKNSHRIKHLVIDEMQDYSELQYQILAELFPCRMTILGDRAQTMDAKIQDVLTFLPKILGKDMRKIILNKSYRNTVEIAEYANALGKITDLEIFERHGKPVTEQRFTNKEDLLQGIINPLQIGPDAFETAAVLALTEDEAFALYHELKERLEEAGYDTEKGLSYVDRNSSAFKKGITVTTFYLAKGLEFDQVFTVMPSRYEKEQETLINQAKYICATRALHELYMYEI